MSVYTLLPNEFVPRFYLGSMPTITHVAEEVIDKAVLENYTDDRIHELQYKIHFGDSYTPESYVSIILSAVHKLREAGKPEKKSKEWKSIVNPSYDEWNRMELVREAEINGQRRLILEKCHEMAEDFSKKTVDQMANIYGSCIPDPERWNAITKLVSPSKLEAVKRRGILIRQALIFSRY